MANPAAVISPLTDLVGEHPFLEPLVALLMRALYAAGRSADALDLYTITRERLVAELGTEPGTELRRTHVEILRDDLDQSRPQRAHTDTTAPPAGPTWSHSGTVKALVWPSEPGPAWQPVWPTPRRDSAMKPSSA